MGALAAVGFFIFLAMGTCVVVAVVVFLVAAWKMMRAHETLAETAREAVGGYRERGKV